mmetsp:Transcript_42927/g.84155  ORF Transcript_42927/g.84155 Transcript_42927/m.84155 type:complete len:1143 (-) Transcript_42927:40-3468(-)
MRGLPSISPDKEKRVLKKLSKSPYAYETPQAAAFARLPKKERKSSRARLGMPLYFVDAPINKAGTRFGIPGMLSRYDIDFGSQTAPSLHKLPFLGFANEFSLSKSPRRRMTQSMSAPHLVSSPSATMRKSRSRSRSPNSRTSPTRGRSVSPTRGRQEVSVSPTRRQREEDWNKKKKLAKRMMKKKRREEREAQKREENRKREAKRKIQKYKLQQEAREREALLQSKLQKDAEAQRMAEWKKKKAEATALEEAKRKERRLRAEQARTAQNNAAKNNTAQNNQTDQKKLAGKQQVRTAANFRAGPAAKGVPGKGALAKGKQKMEPENGEADFSRPGTRAGYCHVGLDVENTGRVSLSLKVQNQDQLAEGEEYGHDNYSDSGAEQKDATSRKKQDEGEKSDDDYEDDEYSDSHDAKDSEKLRTEQEDEYDDQNEAEQDSIQWSDATAENPKTVTAERAEPQNQGATLADDDKQVPLVWEEAKDDSGKIYFWNTETDKTSWKRPENVPIRPWAETDAGKQVIQAKKRQKQKQEEAAKLKQKKEKEAAEAKAKEREQLLLSFTGKIGEAEWQAAVDKSSGEFYYWNLKTDETVWDRPKRVPIRPPEEIEEVRAKERAEKQAQELATFTGKKGETDWQAAFDTESDDYYYWNIKTDEVTWDRPPNIKIRPPEEVEEEMERKEKEQKATKLEDAKKIVQAEEEKQQGTYEAVAPATVGQDVNPKPKISLLPHGGNKPVDDDADEPDYSSSDGEAEGGRDEDAEDGGLLVIPKTPATDGQPPPTVIDDQPQPLREASSSYSSDDDDDYENDESPDDEKKIESKQKDFDPAVWEVFRDENTRQTYYINNVTEKTQWERPESWANNPEYNPDLWLAAADPSSGKVYFCNTDTKVTQWNVPVCVLASDSHNPEFWSSLVDPDTGKTYYVNSKTEETRWEKPTSLPEMPGGQAEVENKLAQDNLKEPIFARCTREFNGTNPEDLSFEAGATISLIKAPPEEGWWVGEVDGARGLFPANYVEVTGFVVSLYPFSGDVPGKEGVVGLPFAAGQNIKVLEAPPQEGWWLGESNGKQGRFPKNYVSAPAKTDDSKGPAMYAKALYPFTSEHPEYLKLKVGQEVKISHRPVNDSWWQGALVDQPEQSGKFPSDCVQIIE